MFDEPLETFPIPASAHTPPDPFSPASFPQLTRPFSSSTSSSELHTTPKLLDPTLLLLPLSPSCPAPSSHFDASPCLAGGVTFNARDHSCGKGSISNAD